jgi:transcriptional regulator with XRE-family HTH domain
MSVLRIKQLRDEKGLSQQKLAELLGHGLTQQKINNYENGRYQPDIEMLKALAIFFEVSIDYLIGHSDIRKSSVERTEYKLDDIEAQYINILRKLPSDVVAKQLEFMKSMLQELDK